MCFLVSEIRISLRPASGYDRMIKEHKNIDKKWYFIMDISYNPPMINMDVHMPENAILSIRTG